VSNLGSALGDPFQNGEGFDDDSSNDGSFDDQEIGSRHNGEEAVHNCGQPSKPVSQTKGVHSFGFYSIKMKKI
jgi:hypothetical protein